MTKLKHQVISTFGKWQMWHASDTETVEDAVNSYTYSDSIVQISTAREFVALSFHLIQQVGGHLYLKKMEVRATKMDQTSGDPDALQGKVKWAHLEVPIEDLLGEG